MIVEDIADDIAWHIADITVTIIAETIGEHITKTIT